MRPVNNIITQVSIIKEHEIKQATDDEGGYQFWEHYENKVDWA